MTALGRFATVADRPEEDIPTVPPYTNAQAKLPHIFAFTDSLTTI